MLTVSSGWERIKDLAGVAQQVDQQQKVQC